MKCKVCQQQCTDEGGLCGGFTFEEREGLRAEGFAVGPAIARHKATDHAMTLAGALWQCAKGHDVDAAPADVMRAAGVRPML